MHICPNNTKFVFFLYIFDYAKNSVKIGFPMPAIKNRFQILNLHPVTYISQIKIPVFKCL